jgi:hypothetical protein
MAKYSLLIHTGGGYSFLSPQEMILTRKESVQNVVTELVDALFGDKTGVRMYHDGPMIPFRYVTRFSLEELPDNYEELRVQRFGKAIAEGAARYEETLEDAL